MRLVCIAIDKGAAGSGAEVSHNLTYKNGSRGIDININGNVKVHHNLIYGNGTDPLIREFGEICISEPVSTEGLEISRNTIRARGKTPLQIAAKKSMLIETARIFPHGVRKARSKRPNTL